MSYRKDSLPPGEWHANDHPIGSRIFLDFGNGEGKSGTVVGNNGLHYQELRLSMKWDDPQNKGDVFPNLQWIGLLPEDSE